MVPLSADGCPISLRHLQQVVGSPVPGQEFDPLPGVVIVMTLYAYTLALGRGIAGPPPHAESPELFFVLLVPCLNEASVIAGTVNRLLALKGEFLVMVIDDDSDDDSVAIVERLLPHERLHVLRRSGAHARLGKGDALNAGYGEIARLRITEMYPVERIIVCVFDADGRVAENFLDQMGPYFSDAATVGAQSSVRMYNADRNLLTRWQDMEFVIWGELFSRAKDRLGSTTLGGNGQCVRLSALRGLGAHPWRPSLTEDLDLSIRLLLNGGRLRFCPAVAVHQQAIPALRSLVRQRSRWMQGHLVAWQYLPRVARSQLPFQSRLDLMVFLIIPVFFVPIGFAAVGSWWAVVGNFGNWTLGGILSTYLLGFPLAPLIVAVLGRHHHRPLSRTIWDAHAYFAYSAIWLAAATVAVWQVILGRRGWAKTMRAKEDAG